MRGVPGDRILAVDDEPAMRRLLRVAAERGGSAIDERRGSCCSTSACPTATDWN